jgi:hypothetical protein
MFGFLSHNGHLKLISPIKNGDFPKLWGSSQRLSDEDSEPSIPQHLPRNGDPPVPAERTARRYLRLPTPDEFKERFFADLRSHVLLLHLAGLLILAPWLCGKHVGI